MNWPDSANESPAVDVSHTSSAAETIAAGEWAALAPLIAGSDHMRFATRAGKYPRPNKAPLITRALPSRPAAVMIHGADGSVATLCLDLDTSKAAQSVVDADAAAICALLTSCGLRHVTDHSPSGGRHIYVPLTVRLAAEDARELVEALGLRFESLDPGPHRNITEGCIRPPGSPHKSGNGYQVLDTPLSQAYDIMRLRNPSGAVAALRLALASAVHQQRVLKSAANTRAFATNVRGPLPETAASKSTALREVARTGVYNRAVHKSASEARMSSLTQLANLNLSLDQIRERFTTDLAGIPKLYGTAKNMCRLLEKEWTKARNRVDQNPPAKRPKRGTSLNSDTEPANTHSGGTAEHRSAASVMQEINDLENVLYAVLDQRLARSGREGISLRLLLRAVIGFARMKKSLVIDVGCRSFGLEMGKHHGTIARLLPLLEKYTEGLVERIERGRGRAADVYLLTIPQQWRSTANALSWRKGKIYGVRPVFWALGDVTALVYEAIERQRTPSTTAEIVRATGIGRTAVDHALTAMAELSMVERHNGTWRPVRSTCLKRLAEWLGFQEIYEDRKLKVKEQRRQWQAHLERFMKQAIYEEDVEDPEMAAYLRGELTLSHRPPPQRQPLAA